MINSVNTAIEAIEIISNVVEYFPTVCQYYLILKTFLLICDYLSIKSCKCKRNTTSLIYIFINPQKRFD